MFKSEHPHPCSVGAPHPGPCSTEEGEKDGLLSMELDEFDHHGVSAWIEEECCHIFPVPIEGDQYRMYEVWVGGEHGNEVVEGGGKVGLECWTLSREKMGHITWYKTTAWQATGTRLLCPVSPQPAYFVSGVPFMLLFSLLKYYWSSSSELLGRHFNLTSFSPSSFSSSNYLKMLLSAHNL